MNQEDLGDLLAKAQEMQTKLASLQQELARRTVSAQSGGGMVTAVVSGDLRVQQLNIEPALVADGDREMLQDLVAAAVNAALGTAQRMVQEEMQKAAVMAGLPGMGGLGGPGGPAAGNT
ncbi:MAG: YbaB/EbfC family nucleoid-associated protein [Deltaproteobacteria bacterium]|nr:YbaB/EbfC family nucleoid-associated protein [Deltaproteobacteria bacterium]